MYHKAVIGWHLHGWRHDGQVTLIASTMRRSIGPCVTCQNIASVTLAQAVLMQVMQSACLVRVVASTASVEANSSDANVDLVTRRCDLEARSITWHARSTEVLAPL